MESPNSLQSLPSLQNLPPGSKFLNCVEARNVFQNCPTWRLPNGSVLAPFGGELYQVVELPSDCGDRCTVLQSTKPSPSTSPTPQDNLRIINNNWLKFRRQEEYARQVATRSECYPPRMPVFYTDGRLCNCQFCEATMYPERFYGQYSQRKPLDSICRLKQERFSPSFSTEDGEAPTGMFPFSLPMSSQASSHVTSSDEQRRPKQKRFQCVHCDKSFGKSSHLRDHIRTHTGDRPFRCQFCNKAFTQYSNLRTHTRIHTGEKPFKCQHCSKSFTQAVTLRSHTRTHTGDKPYNCKRCSKSFSCFSGLRGHNRIHAEEEGTTLDLELDIPTNEVNYN